MRVLLMYQSPEGRYLQPFPVRVYRVSTPNELPVWFTGSASFLQRPNAADRDYFLIAS
jgi:hypothetical protein